MNEVLEKTTKSIEKFIENAETEPRKKCSINEI